MDAEGSVFNNVHRQDGVAVGVGGMYGYEDDHPCDTAYTPDQTHAAVVDRLVNELPVTAIGVTHVVLDNGLLVPVGYLPIVGTRDGQLVVKLPEGLNA